MSGEREGHLSGAVEPNQAARRGEAGSLREKIVFKVDFTVKLLRACVWMPRRKQAKKDVVSCEKLRGAANRL